MGNVEMEHIQSQSINESDDSHERFWLVEFAERQGVEQLTSAELTLIEELRWRSEYLTPKQKMMLEAKISEITRLQKILDVAEFQPGARGEIGDRNKHRTDVRAQQAQLNKKINDVMKWIDEQNWTPNTYIKNESENQSPKDVFQRALRYLLLLSIALNFAFAKEQSVAQEKDPNEAGQPALVSEGKRGVNEQMEQEQVGFLELNVNLGDKDLPLVITFGEVHGGFVAGSATKPEEGPGDRLNFTEDYKRPVGTSEKSALDIMHDFFVENMIVRYYVGGSGEQKAHLLTDLGLSSNQEITTEKLREKVRQIIQDGGKLPIIKFIPGKNPYGSVSQEFDLNKPVILVPLSDDLAQEILESNISKAQTLAFNRRDHDQVIMAGVTEDGRLVFMYSSSLPDMETIASLTTLVFTIPNGYGGTAGKITNDDVKELLSNMEMLSYYNSWASPAVIIH